MEGLDDNFNDIVGKSTDDIGNAVDVQGWTEADLETYFDFATIDKINNVNNKELLYEIRDVIIGDSSGAPNEDEGHQKVKRW